jgi:hypothetical protein
MEDIFILDPKTGESVGRGKKGFEQFEQRVKEERRAARIFRQGLRKQIFRAEVERFKKFRNDFVNKIKKLKPEELIKQQQKLESVQRLTEKQYIKLEEIEDEIERRKKLGGLAISVLGGGAVVGGAIVGGAVVGGVVANQIKKQSNESRLKDGVLNNEVKNNGSNQFRDDPARPQVIDPENEPYKHENKKYMRQSPFMNRINTLPIIN